MSNPVRILAIAGSLRGQPYDRAAAAQQRSLFLQATIETFKLDGFSQDKTKNAIDWASRPHGDNA